MDTYVVIVTLQDIGWRAETSVLGVFSDIHKARKCLDDAFDSKREEFDKVELIEDVDYKGDNFFHLEDEDSLWYVRCEIHEQRLE